MKLLLFALLSLSSFQALAFDHQPWDQLLKNHVSYLNGGQQSTVDYQGFTDDRDQLKTYLDSLSSVTRQTFDSWPTDKQLAFLINAYNAWTVELILTRYPDIDSIRDFGSFFGLLSSPWKKEFIPLLEETRSLDNIEHDMIRGTERYREPRIHFAVNCASIGCPALRNEAFTAEKLEQQMEEQTRLFLADRSRNHVDNNTLFVSKIFDWYREDFEKGWKGYHSLEDFLLDYADALALEQDQKTRLANKNMRIRFTDYNWALNDIQKP